MTTEPREPKQLSEKLTSEGVVVACPCGRRNRRVHARLAEPARCGGCGAALCAPGSPLEVPDAAIFDAAVRGASLPILVDFWAPWCGPCRAVAPEIERLAAQRAGRLLVLKVDTEALPALGQQLRISSIPTLALYREGRECARSAGARPAAQIAAFVDEALASQASG